MSNMPWESNDYKDTELEKRTEDLSETLNREEKKTDEKHNK